MWRGADVKMSRCEDEKVWEKVWRWDVKMRRREDEKAWRWDVKMSRCEDEQMWRWADVKMRRCEDEKVWRWEGVKMRCEEEQMWRWEGVKIRGCEDEKMWRWEGVKMRRCEDEKVWRWEGVKMRCEEEQMWRWEGVKIRGCEDEKMWRWEGVKMSRCEDEKVWEKVWRWEDEIQTRTIGRTLRSDALGKNQLWNDGRLLYLFFVVLATLFAQQIWKVGERLVRAAAQRRQVPSPGSLPGEAKRGEKTSMGVLRCCCPLSCLTINFFVLFSAAAGSSEKCSVTKRSTKGEKFSKDGSLAKCDTIVKGSTAEIKITGLKHAHRWRGHLWKLGWNRKRGKTDPNGAECCCTRWSEFGSHRSTAGWRISRFTISGVFDTFWRSLSFEPKLSTFGFGEDWPGERIKMVQSMPTLCLSKWISSCSWCHPVSESVRKCCTFRYEMPYSTRIESSATVHGMFKNQKFNSLSLAERWKVQSGSFKGECCCGTTLPFSFAFAHFKSFNLSGAELNLMRTGAEAWIRRRLGILGGWAWWSTRASSFIIYIIHYISYIYIYLHIYI